MTTSANDAPSGPTRAIADFAFGGRTGVVDVSRPLAWLSPEEMEIDLTDQVARRFGDYELIEKIGQGGMGVVYRARQHGLERDVAVKLLSAGPWASEEFVARFRREARSAARMQHPNIVEIYEFGHRDGLNYFSMRLIEGQTLAQKLAAAGPLPAKDAAALLRTLAEAMDYAHRLGVLHLDLKPANVLLTPDGVPLIADFGLARRIDAGHDGGTEISGTPSYMAPEQATLESHPLSASTDIYGLGAVLYECLTGRAPFVGDTHAVLERVATEAPAAPRTLRLDVPADLEAICLKCLEKDPAQRYATARELADDLQRFGEGRPVSVHPLNTVQRAMRWARREPRMAFTTVAAFAALAIGFAVATLQWREAEAARALAEAQRREAAAQRERALASAAEMEKAVELSVGLFTDGAQPPGDVELLRRATATVAMLQASTHGDDVLLARILASFTKSLVRVKGPEGAQPIVAAIVESFGAPFRAKVASAWEARGGADDLVVAALWSRPADNRLQEYWQVQDSLKVRPMGEFGARIQRAHALEPDAAMPLYVAALYCDPRAGECAIPGAAAKLAALEPDNAANWALAADRERAQGATLRAYLSSAARAPRFDDRLSALFAQFQRGLDESGVPLPPTMLRPLAEAAGSDRPAFLPIYWEFQLRPVFSQHPFMTLCDPARPDVRDPAIRADCVAYSRKLVESHGGMLQNHLGQVMLRRLFKGTPTERAMAGKRREYLWMAAQPGVMQVVAEHGGGWEDLMRDAARVGEMEAFELRMERLGYVRTPPEGWLPSDPEQLLLPEDRRPAPKESP